MKKLYRALLLSFGVLFIWGFISVTLAQVISSRNYKYNNVPKYYYANYKFADDWDKIKDWFTKAKAKFSLEIDIPSSDFGDLAEYFDAVFPHLTKDYSVVYEKCSLLAHQMSNGYSERELEGFMGNSCYNSLMQAINKINSSYTVQPSVTTNPSSWMAPLTVTLDARGSTDPSSETLPTDKFYRYYRDENWVDNPIWEWQIKNYTFDEPGKFVVHLVIRSSNVDSGILDWERDMTINVTPKAADIVVYANTRRMEKNWPLKIWTTEWEEWVVFDGSLTMPRWWRKILFHKWTITNNSETIYDSKWEEGKPNYINRKLEWSWLFKVTLMTQDNESNIVSETYDIYTSDPVGIIRQSPQKWTTSTTFNFDWSASYSIISRLNTYYWEVFDARWEEDGETKHWDTIKWWSDKKFSINFADLKKSPWNYLVRLTVTDILWNTNVEEKELFVESTPPTPQFTTVPTKIWTYPSEFTLDASSSTDIDVENKLDSLEYSRSFSKPEDVSLISTENNNEKMVVRFNSVGKHTITLTVTDEYWASAKISKTLDIKSILRPEITAIPWAITWWRNMQFKSSINNTNDPIYEYEWDFWDGMNNASQFLTDATHVYAQKWIYTVTLRVTTKDSWGDINRNDVKERVFIWEKDSPIAARKVKDGGGYKIEATEKCRIETSEWIEEVLGYPVDRYEKFTIDPWISVNTMWNSKWLKKIFSKQAISWQDKTKEWEQYTDSFSELGCHYVDLQVSDNNVWKEDKVRIRFSVKNALPTLKNVVLSFPQYAEDPNMIWFWDVNNNRMSFDCWTSNLTIKVTAVTAEDPDWMISRLRFYYYNADDPERKLEYKDTWTSTPYVYFVLPRIWWEYKFWVWVYDNDGWMIDSDEYLASNPAVYFPASCSDSDIPTVTLKESSNNIQVWDEVTYTIVSKLSTNNEDFATDRTFYYDFTWDWVRDLVTKKDTATYQFLEDYEEWVTPRAAVEYRRKLWIADWGVIYVKNGIKPILLFNSIWNTVIFRDLSVGVFQQRSICFETSKCDAWEWNGKFKKIHVVNDLESLAAWISTDITKNNSFLQNYKEYWAHNVSLYLKSKYWMEAEQTYIVNTSNNESNGRIAPWVNMITIPKTTFQKIEDTETWKVKDIRAEIFLAKNMDNTLLMYVNNENEWACYVDADIATDSDWDNKTDNDTDFLCNKIAKIKYEPDYENTIWRIYFTVKDETGKENLTFKNFYVSFEWYILELDEEKTEIYKDITILIDGIDDISTENTNLKNNLNKLRRKLNSTSEVSALVIDIKEQIEKWWIKMDTNQKERLESILSRLDNPDTIIAEVSVWADGYEKNKSEILALLPTEKWLTIKEDVAWLFKEFEEKADTPEKKIESLNMIRETILKDNKKNKRWDENDYTPYFCNIYEYFDIERWTNKCWSNLETKSVQENYVKSQSNDKSSWEKKWWLPLRLIIILVILVWWVLTMVWIIVFFSIKAKLSSSSENDEE